MFSKRKFFIGITGTLIVVLIAGFLFARHLVTRSFPEYEGTIEVSGIHAPVTIERDEYGVPRITAGSEGDAFFAAGFVHAQDRLWQMEMSRRAGEGRLAEVLGEEALHIDLLFRTMDFQSLADEIFDRLPEDYKRMLDRYAAGVNHLIEMSEGRYPIEFDILQFTPEPWLPRHSLLLGKLMAWELCIAWWTDVALGQLIESMDFDLAIQAIPGYPEHAPRIVSPLTADSEIASALRQLRRSDEDYRRLSGIPGSQVGSNSWVVSGERSASGKPILANDLHLGLSAPSRWYEMSIRGGSEFDVAGMTLPGIPLVVIGRNRAVAWGLTNVMADDADFYIEDIDTTAPPRYRVDTTWHDLRVREEIFSIRNGEERTSRIFETHRGPLVQSLVGTEPGLWDNQAISMRWTGRKPTNEFIAVYLLNKAASIDDFREALRHFEAPGMNFVYADTAGNIAYRPGVAVPLRPRGNPMLPFPGWDSSYDWSGFIPFNELPELVNPSSGLIATANNMIVDDAYPYYISSLWEHTSRIERIFEMFDEEEVFLVSDFKRMQNDYISVHARNVVPYILDAFDGVESDDQDVRRALSYFRNWDYYFGPEDVPAALFNVFMNRLFRNTFAPHMGDELYREYTAVTSIPYRAMDQLLADPNSEWFDNPSTQQRERRDIVIRNSLQDAIDYLRREIGDDIRTWRWGALHTVTIRHMFGERTPFNKVVNIGPHPVGGSSTTVNKGQYFIFDPYDMVLGASTRFIVDMSDPSTAYTVIPTGQSGQPLHRHYSDQTLLWLDGRYKTTAMDRTENTLYRTIILQPE
jgi:penicillin G amidase